MNIGSAIRHCRLNREISQKQLAELADVSVSHLCLIEKSKREASIPTLEAVADALQIPVTIIVLLAANEKELSQNSATDLDKLTKLVDKLSKNAIK